MSDDAAAQPPRLRSLIPPPRAPQETLTAQQALAGWREQEARSSPRVALNMVASLDGRIAVDGRSAPLSSPADRALFHELRAQADAVMAGARTMRLERYGPIIAKAATRERRLREGLAEQPLAVIASRSLELDPQLPLLADPNSRVVILTNSQHDVPGPCAARLDYVRAPTLRAGLAQLAERHGVATLVCEGGPTLNGSLAAEELIDELFLAQAPLLVGEAPGGSSLVRGHALSEPEPFELRMLLECDGQLYGRYVRR